MNCYIKEIIIFNKKGEKRFVPLKPGLNIITGESKTGKSALIEIVDYCLTSKTSGIPKGIISDFGYLYSIILAFPNKYLVIGRKAFLEGGNSKMYLKVESSFQAIQDIQLSYFENLQLELRDKVRVEIEKHLGLSVMDMTDRSEAERERGKSSLRNMMPFLFQHQNLVANKHVLFYQFEDFYRKNTIEEFPVFAGWTSDEYYHLNRQLDYNRKELKKIKSSIERREMARQEVEQELRGYFKNYYALIGKHFDETLSLEQLFALRNQLPDYDSKTFVSQNIVHRSNQLKQERDTKKRQLTQIGVKIGELNETQQYANDYQVNLGVLDMVSHYPDNINIPRDSFCPLCGKESENISKQAQQLKESKAKLAKELKQVSTYSISYTREIDELSRKQDQLRKEIRLLETQIRDIEQTVQEIKKQQRVETTIIYAKAKLDIRTSEIEKEKNMPITDDKTAEIEGAIEILEKRLSGFNLENLFKKAESFLNESMSKICERLDFEEELRPANLWFKLEDDFTLFHADKRLGKVSINEMGSGANWLACHLSLFLSFLHLFTKKEQEHSTVPSFLFLDQPSQIYFPNEFDLEKDKEIKQVAKIYITIIDKIAEIEKECGYAPQVVITDHADKLDLGKYEFENFVRKRWRKGEGLI